MQIEDRGIICDTSKRLKSERVASFTSLCLASAGSIFSVFQIGSTKLALDSTLLICRSKDHGRTWKELSTRFSNRINNIAGMFTSGEMAEVEPGKLLLIATWFDRSEPERPLFDPVTEGILHSKLLAAFSNDDGETWSSWNELSTGDLKGCAGTGPIVKWSDGTLAFPFESYKEFDDPRPSVHGAWCMVSTEGGKSFGKPILVAQDPEHSRYYWDQRLCAGHTPGEFTALFWTHDLKNKKDLDVHFRRGSLFEANNKSAEIFPTHIPGQIAAPLLLDDARLLAFVVNRGRPGTLSLWSSRDGGASWPEQFVVYTHDEKAALTQGAENIDYAQYWEDMGKWSFGHPAIRSLGDGKILVAYYAGTPDCMSPRWARIDTRR